ncbi:MAG: hypothetical protein RR278_07030 [Mucinivorans sp.]
MVTSKNTHVKRIVYWLSIFFLMTVTVTCAEGPTYRLEKGELFPGGKLVGQPKTSKMTEIRMVRVSSRQEADSFFVALARNDKHKCTLHYKHGYGWCCRNQKTGGEMIYTSKVPSGTYQVGIIYIHDSLINARGIKEVHFVETIKSATIK